MTDTVILESVLNKTAAVLDGVPPGRGSAPTPCPDYTVDQLVHHMVSWATVFANAGAGDSQPKDPEAAEFDDPTAAFRAAVGKAVAGYGGRADDEKVTLSSGEMPAAAGVAMMTGEYLAHGWDLAIATGQPVEFTDDEAEAARVGLSPLLAPEYRGPGKAFGDVVEVPEEASGLDRFLGFSGRQPR